jgi:hypothetical protein
MVTVMMWSQQGQGKGGRFTGSPGRRHIRAGANDVNRLLTLFRNLYKNNELESHTVPFQFTNWEKF